MHISFKIHRIPFYCTSYGRLAELRQRVCVIADSRLQPHTNSCEIIAFSFRVVTVNSETRMKCICYLHYPLRMCMTATFSTRAKKINVLRLTSFCSVTNIISQQINNYLLIFHLQTVYLA